MEESSSEITSVVDVTSTTLRNWADRGLIDAPVIRPGPGGRGTSGYYAAGTLKKCQRIRELRSEGKSLAEIKVIFEDEAKRSSRKAKAGRTSRDAGRRLQIRDRIVKESKRLARDIRNQKTAGLITDDDVNKAVRLAAAGKRPIVLILEGRIRVLPGDDLSAYVAHQDGVTAFLVVCIADLFDDCDGSDETDSSIERFKDGTKQKPRKNKRKPSQPMPTFYERVIDVFTSE